MVRPRLSGLRLKQRAEYILFRDSQEKIVQRPVFPGGIESIWGTDILFYCTILGRVSQRCVTGYCRPRYIGALRPNGQVQKDGRFLSVVLVWRSHAKCRGVELGKEKFIAHLPLLYSFLTNSSRTFVHLVNTCRNNQYMKCMQKKNPRPAKKFNIISCPNSEMLDYRFCTT